MLGRPATGVVGPGAKPVALEIKEGEPALVVVTASGKYQAMFHGDARSK